MATKDKIPILFFCDEIQQATAGTEQNISFLLKNLPPDRFETHFVLLRNDKGLPLGFSPVKPECLNLHSFKKPLETYRVLNDLKKTVQKYKIKIVHAFFRDCEFLSAIARLNLLNCFRIVARRSAGYDDTFLIRMRNLFLARLETNYVVNSEAIKCHLIEFERIPENRITVIHNPINRERLDQGIASPPERKRWNLDDNDLVVGIVANIRPVKDYETFFQAAMLVAEKVENVKFVIVGSRDEKYWGNLKRWVESSRLKTRLVFTGPVDNPISLMRTFDVGVLCSISEGLSNSLIEYAAVGIPAVVTDVGGNREIVEDGVNGYIVPPRSPAILASKIIDLLRNEEKRIKFGTKARATALSKFDQDYIIQQYDRFYTKVIKKA